MAELNRVALCRYVKMNNKEYEKKIKIVSNYIDFYLFQQTKSCCSRTSYWH